MTIPGIFSQRDGRWSGDVLGNNPGSPWIIYNYGCLISSIANLIWYVTGDSGHTPRWANEWLRNMGGFTPGGGLVIWDTLANGLTQFGIQSHGYTGDLNEVNNFLAPEQNYAIAWITKPGFPQHWAIMPYVGMIADPWDGKLKPVGTYTFHGAHLYTHVIPAVVTPPAPVVVPVPEIPVIESPTVPVPSNETPVENPQPETEVKAEPLPVAWTDTWTALERTMTIQRDGAVAVRLEDGSVVTTIPKGYTTLYAGTYEKDGAKYYCTPLGHQNGVGVASEYFDEPTGQNTGNVAVKVVKQAKDELFEHITYDADDFRRSIQDGAGWLKKLGDLAGKIVAALIKRKENKESL